MEETEIPIAPLPETVTCENCKATNESSRKFCTACSFPIGGSVEEKTAFHNKIKGHKFLMEEAASGARSSRNTILILAAVFFIAGLVAQFANDDTAGMMVNMIICALYLVLAAWCAKNPFGAILTAAIIFATITLVNAFFDPKTLFGGIIFKFLIIGGFIRGIRSARETQEHLNELKKLKAVPDAGA